MHGILRHQVRAIGQRFRTTLMPFTWWCLHTIMRCTWQLSLYCIFSFLTKLMSSTQLRFISPVSCSIASSGWWKCSLCFMQGYHFDQWHDAAQAKGPNLIVNQLFQIYVPVCNLKHVADVQSRRSVTLKWVNISHWLGYNVSLIL